MLKLAERLRRNAAGAGGDQRLGLLDGGGDPPAEEIRCLDRVSLGAQRIRASPWGARMVLVGLTGWGGEDVRRRAFESGFDHHVTKPAQLDVIQELLRKVPDEDELPRGAER